MRSFILMSGLVFLVSCKTSSDSDLEIAQSGKNNTFVELSASDISMLFEASERRLNERVETSASKWSCTNGVAHWTCSYSNGQSTMYMSGDEIRQLDEACKSNIRVLDVKTSITPGNWNCVEGIVKGKRCSFSFRRLN